MRSKMDANIYIVGDACIPGQMPKSAFSANSQAKVAAMMIRGELAGAKTFPARYSNTCWSLIETDDNIKVGGTYEPGRHHQGIVDLRLEARRAGRHPQAELSGVDRLVSQHRLRHLRLNDQRLRNAAAAKAAAVVVCLYRFSTRSRSCASRRCASILGPISSPS